MLFLSLIFRHNMSNKKPKIHNPNSLIKVIEKWPNPMFDARHGYCLYVEGKAKSNQTRAEHIIQDRHDLKARDLESVPEGITNYFEYKKDPIYKDTFNYYIKRKGLDRGFIKVSVQIDHRNSAKAWIKTVYITYRIK